MRIQKCVLVSDVCFQTHCMLGMERLNRLGVARAGCLVWAQEALNVYLTGKAALDGIGRLTLETVWEGQGLAIEGVPYGSG